MLDCFWGTLAPSDMGAELLCCPWGGVVRPGTVVWLEGSFCGCSYFQVTHSKFVAPHRAWQKEPCGPGSRRGLAVLGRAHPWATPQSSAGEQGPGPRRSLTENQQVAEALEDLVGVVQGCPLLSGHHLEKRQSYRAGGEMG